MLLVFERVKVPEPSLVSANTPPIAPLMVRLPLPPILLLPVIVTAPDWVAAVVVLLLINAPMPPTPAPMMLMALLLP